MREITLRGNSTQTYYFHKWVTHCQRVRALCEDDKGKISLFPHEEITFCTPVAANDVTLTVGHRFRGPHKKQWEDIVKKALKR